MREVPEMAADLTASHPEWWSWRVSHREQEARKVVVERYGMSLPVVVEEVARYRPPDSTPGDPASANPTLL